MLRLTSLFNNLCNRLHKIFYKQYIETDTKEFGGSALHVYVIISVIDYIKYFTKAFGGLRITRLFNNLSNNLQKIFYKQYIETDTKAFGGLRITRLCNNFCNNLCNNSCNNLGNILCNNLDTLIYVLMYLNKSGYNTIII